MRNFQDKVVVVTGAGSGMGRAYALEFAKRGARLALNDYSEESLNETVEMLTRQSGKLGCAAAFDVSDEQAMQRFAARVEAELGGADLVINNAGIEGAVKPVWACEKSDYERIMAVNFYGVVNGTRAFLPQLMQKKEAAVVNVSSIFGLIGTPNSSDYCASKFAVRGFTEALMVELRESSVDAYLVHPGGVDTNIAQKSESQEFTKRYLTTPPDTMVRHVIRCIQRRRFRIVYGNNARRVWAAGNLVPLKSLVSVLWREMKSVTDLRYYSFLQ